MITTYPQDPDLSHTRRRDIKPTSRHADSYDYAILAHHALGFTVVECWRDGAPSCDVFRFASAQDARRWLDGARCCNTIQTLHNTHPYTITHVL